jgi:hypothetical protein
MKLAVMQPYIFPYLGYFQLIAASDVFVFYDDVNFIKGGWIHRNRILVNNSNNMFTIPLIKPSSFRSISETEINFGILDKWKRTFFKTITQSYKKAPYFKEIYLLIDSVLSLKEPITISVLASKSILEVFNYLEIEKRWLYSSHQFPDSKNKGRTERLLYMATELGCDTYINSIGGKELYVSTDFINAGITLKFIKMEEVVYSQSSNKFVPNLSIIDVLMYNSKAEVHTLLEKYSLTD